MRFKVWLKLQSTGIVEVNLPEDTSEEKIIEAAFQQHYADPTAWETELRDAEVLEP